MYSYIIIDDEPLIRKGLQKKIQSFDTALLYSGEADNGEDALDLISAVDPDIIFTDMRMPVMDGKSLLRVLQQDYAGKKIIVVSGHSDFEYMQEAISAKVISYLLKPFSREEIHRTLQKAIESLDSEQSAKQDAVFKTIEHEDISYRSDLQLLQNLISGDHNKERALAFRSAAMKSLADRKLYILLTIYNLEEIPAEIPEQYLDTNLIYLLHAQSDNLAYILLAYDCNLLEETVLEQAVTVAESIIHLLSQNTINKACVGISGIKNSLELLNYAQQETITALNNRTIADFGFCYLYTPGKLFPDVQLWEKINDLLFYLESGNSPKVREYVIDFFAFYIRQPHVTLAQLKNQCRVIVQEVKKILDVYFQTSSNQTSSASLESVLNTSFDLENIRSYFLTVLLDITDLLKEMSAYSSPHVIDNVKTYIQKNFRNELTLDKVSSLFYMNASYLSYLFKEKTGTNFIDYINSLRIERAKLMLTSSDDKVYRIAKSLGFDNAKYFFRIFKKMTGCTPEEYRNKS